MSSLTGLLTWSAWEFHNLLPLPALFPGGNTAGLSEEATYYQQDLNGNKHAYFCLFVCLQK